VLELDQAAQAQAAAVLLAQSRERGPVEAHRGAGTRFGVGDPAVKRAAAARAGVAIVVHDGKWFCQV